MVGGLGVTEWGDSHGKRAATRKEGWAPVLGEMVGGRHTGQEKPTDATRSTGLLADLPWKCPLPERSFLFKMFSRGARLPRMGKRGAKAHSRRGPGEGQGR